MIDPTILAKYPIAGEDEDFAPYENESEENLDEDEGLVYEKPEENKHKASIKNLDDEQDEIETETEQETEVEAEVEPVEEESDPDTDADDIKSKAADYDKWAERWARDPAGFIAKYYDAMTPEQKAHFLQITGSQPEAEQNEVQAWEPESLAEEWLLSHKQAIESFPQQFPKLAEAVNNEFQFRDQLAHEHYIELASLRAQVSGLVQLLGTSLPELDKKSVEKLLGEGKSYFEAVDSVYKPVLEKSVKNSKQASKPRPSTPASSRSQETINDKSALAIFRKLSA